MCIGVYTLEHPDYALILATNRDEFLHRPTVDAHWHSFADGHAHHALSTYKRHSSSSAIEQTTSTIGTAVLPVQSAQADPASNTTPFSQPPTPAETILSGLDLQAGGTWLGVSRTGGRVAMLTNITEEFAKWAVSRGELVKDFLTMSDTAESGIKSESGLGIENSEENAALRRWEEKMGVNAGGGKGEYAGFNLLLLAPRINGEGSEARVVYDARYVTNHGGGGRLASRSLSAAERRCGGISNGVDHASAGQSRASSISVPKASAGAHDGSRAGEAVEADVGEDAADWPKVRHARGDFARVLQREEMSGSELTEDELVERLFGILEWHPTPIPVARRNELRTTVHVLPMRIVLPVVTDNNHNRADPAPTSHSGNATTPTTAADINATQTVETAPTAPGSTPISTQTEGSALGPTTTPVSVQGSIAGPTPQSTFDRPRPTSASASKTSKPKTDPKTEIPPAFYGTRLATVVLVPRDPAREVLFVERDIWALGAGDADLGEDPDLVRAGDSALDLRDSGKEVKPVRVDKSRQRVFRFRMDYGQ